jgi:hypothetical protein
MAARRSYSRTSYPARSAARRRAAAPKRKPAKEKSDDYTKWLIVGSAAVLAFFVFREREAEAAVLRLPLPGVDPVVPKEPVSVVTPGRFIRAGGAGTELKCFDTTQSAFVQDFFCEQSDEAEIGDEFFFPKG